MIFLRDEEAAVAWKREAPGLREVFPLDVAIQFAAEYFAPLLED